jgi:hypothetical protein
MHHREGILAIIISLSLALALLPLAITGANGTVTVGIDAPAEVEAGSSFVADVTVDWVTDFDSCGFDVTYDETIITVTDITGGEIDGHAVEVPTGYWSYIPYGEEDTGRIRVIATIPATPAPGVTGTGYLVQIHFEVLGSGGSTSDITPEEVGMYDWQANIISTTTEDHSVQVFLPTEPIIAFNPKRFTFSATEGGANPASQILEIWNAGPRTLEWSVSDNADWLSLSPTNGSSTGEKDEVSISVDVAGMSAGDYSAAITIAAAGATNTPRTLAVSLTLTEPEAPTIAFGPASLSFIAVAGEANPPNQTLEIWNSGIGTLDWSVSDDAAWLTLAPASDSSTGEHDVVTVTASVDVTGMTAGIYPATITITAAGAANTPRTASVSLYVSDASGEIAKSVATATGTGTAFFIPSQGVIEQLTSVDEATLPEEGKPDFEFPHGFFSFNIVGGTPGDEVEVGIIFPDSVPPDTQYWKYYDNEWHQIPMRIDPDDDKVIVITLVDGGLGDADGMADGTIVDPGGPGNPSPDGGGGHHISKAAIVALSITAGVAIIVGIILLVRRRRSTV